MSIMFDRKTVQILCHCERYLPLCRTYFCRYCYQIRCSNCITHEVDCYYCPTCLETMASGEANSRKDKCTNCFDCPSCGNMLSLRASVLQVPNADDPKKPDLQKFYYMACSYCRWTTRESDIPDRKTSTNFWPQNENPYNKQIKSLIESFNQFASKEKLEKERHKYANRKNYFFLMDSVIGTNRRRYSTQLRLSKRHSEVEKPIQIQPMEAKEDISDISEDFFERKFCLEDVTNIEQRLRDPERQPRSMKNFRPISKQILVKRSMRCKNCDHNLSKPEIATNSIRFKINLGSVYHVPEIKIKLLPKSAAFEFNKTQKIIITITNPAHRVTTVKLGPIVDHIDSISTAKLQLPSVDLKIGAKNEIMGIDDIDNITNEFEGEDDTTIIAARKANKIEIYAYITPMKSKGPIIACIQLTFDYKDATSYITNSSKEGAANVDDISLRTVTYRLELGSVVNVTDS